MKKYINSIAGYIYVGNYSETNLYGKKSTTGNGYYKTIQVYRDNKNKLKAGVFYETAEFINEMYKKHGESTSIPSIINKNIEKVKSNFNI